MKTVWIAGGLVAILLTALGLRCYTRRKAASLTDNDIWDPGFRAFRIACRNFAQGINCAEEDAVDYLP